MGYCFVNSGNLMNEVFQNTDNYISNQSGLYKSNEHSQNRYVSYINVIEKEVSRKYFVRAVGVKMM